MAETAELAIQKLGVYKDRMVELKELFRYGLRLTLVIPTRAHWNLLL